MSVAVAQGVASGAPAFLPRLLFVQSAGHAAASQQGGRR